MISFRLGWIFKQLNISRKIHVLFLQASLDLLDNGIESMHTSYVPDYPFPLPSQIVGEISRENTPLEFTLLLPLAYDFYGLQW